MLNLSDSHLWPHQKSYSTWQDEKAPAAGSPSPIQLGLKSDLSAANGGFPSFSVVREVLSRKREKVTEGLRIELELEL